ncbi:facilitated trehalose transporter Tret1-2 homolog isoform X1 [Neodiprion fabricii]|uniref:facilitated trehalose transporter Tret1-2 homolog isoform X1 n=2 Tax=Neodiprion fabricii TaxID=2872261 RepID=UPI001ED8E597|nr:facilitated trehalose transporter Tret1-2 homolog isoform X1 [Neodiprion fabricii]
MEKSKVMTQSVAGFAATMSVACAGFHFGWSAPSLPKLLDEDSNVTVTSDESSWIVSFFTFGCVFGPLIGAAVVDRWGRKWSLLFTVLPYLSSCILIGFAPSFWWFAIARFIAGLGSGITYTVAPMYLGEIADDRIRGALGAMINHMLNAGILLTYCVGPWVSPVALAGMGAAFPLLFGLMFFWMPESPYFLVMKGKMDRAEKSLLWFRGTSNVIEELKQVQENVEFDQKNAGTVKELVMIPGNRKALIIVIGLMIAQQFSGIGAVLAYSGLIFEASGSSLDSSISVIIIGVVQVLSGVLTIFTVDLAGRKPLLLISACGSILFLGGEALYFQLQAVDVDVSSISWLPVTAIVGYIIVYTIGLGCLPYVVLSEIFPCNVKALATMVTSIFGALGGMAVAKLYQVVADEYGIHASFWGFAAITVFSMIFIYFVIPETKQRSLRDIQEEFHKTTEFKTVSDKSLDP